MLDKLLNSKYLYNIIMSIGHWLSITPLYRITVILLLVIVLIAMLQVSYLMYQNPLQFRQDIINLVGERPAGQHMRERLLETGFEVSPAPLTVATRPVDPQNILRRYLPLLAIVVAQLNRVGTVRVDDHHDVQAAASGKKIRREAHR